MPIFGDRSVLVEGVPHPHRLVPVVQQAWKDALVRAGMDALLVEFSEPRADLRHIATDIEAFVASAQHDVVITESREVTIPVVYDGEDLEVVAAQLGLTIDQLIERHLQTPWRVAMIGFAPGFPYLVPEDARQWSLPRRETPRAKVPAGSVALAAGMSAIYPTAMPGGWHLIGSTAERLFDVNADPPAVLRVGDMVRFVVQR